MAVRNEVRTSRWQNTARALWIGTGLQVVCLLLPLLDLWVFGSVENHVEAAYPGWDASEVAKDRDAIVVAVLIVGVLGLVGWLLALWAVRRDRAVRATVTTLFALGLTTLATIAGAGGDPYDQYVPLWLGSTILVLLAVPGGAAVLAAWFRDRDVR